MSSCPIRIVLVDDQPLFRRGAASALREDPRLEVVAEKANGDTALNAILDLEPDVAVIDGTLPQLERTRLLREITRRQSQTKVLVVTPPDDPKAVESALASGVGGYLTRHADETELCGAVAIVARGGTALSEKLRASLVEAVARGAAGATNPLSDGERQILTQIAQGLSAPLIAEHRHISEATVRTCLRRIYDKLGVPNKAAAVAEAMRRNLIDYPPRTPRTTTSPARTTRNGHKPGDITPPHPTPEPANA